MIPWTGLSASVERIGYARPVYIAARASVLFRSFPRDLTRDAPRPVTRAAGALANPSLALSYSKAVLRLHAIVGYPTVDALLLRGGRSAAVGAVGLLLLTKTPLNVSSLMGLILLVGLVVKNGIILLDFTRHRMQEERVPLGVALQEAGRVRLRPILMTTLCTLFGLLPLALGLGAGAELQKPLALAVIGGLALSTPITPSLVPALLVAVREPDYTTAA